MIDVRRPARMAYVDFDHGLRLPSFRENCWVLQDMQKHFAWQEAAANPRQISSKQEIVPLLHNVKFAPAWPCVCAGEGLRGS